LTIELTIDDWIVDYPMLTAITRPVSERIAECELTHLDRVPIDVGLAAAQHQQYEAALAELGCAVRRVPVAHELPDSVFVEDVAIVLDAIAIVTRPGAASRRPEREGVAAVLSDYRPLRVIEAPGTLDGGDVLRLGRRLFVGLSTRTNEDGARQLARLTEPFGYTVQCVQTDTCLHLKSAVTGIEPDRVLCNPAWIDVRAFAGIGLVEVDPDEPSAANVLRIGDTILAAAAHARTVARLREREYRVCTVDVSELAKAEAGVTCCSLIIES
jgi:dimethylargininase